MTQNLIGNSFEIWLAEQWENLIGDSPLLFPSPPGYFEVKAELDKVDCIDRDAQSILVDFTWVIE